MNGEIQSTETPSGAKRFGPAARALRQRRWLLWALKGVLAALVVVVTMTLQPADKSQALLLWTVAAALGVMIVMAQGAWVLDPIRTKQVLLHEAALELNRGGYRRFVVFEGLKHVLAVQNAGEHIIEIVLHTADDSVRIRDVEGLGEIFAAVCAAKSAGVLVEVEERRVDWGEPGVWLAAATVGLALIGFLWLG